jgi:hypothetical protein
MRKASTDSEFLSALVEIKNDLDSGAIHGSDARARIRSTMARFGWRFRLDAGDDTDRLSWQTPAIRRRD